MPQVVLKKEWGTAKCSFLQNRSDFETDHYTKQNKEKNSRKCCLFPRKSFVRSPVSKTNADKIS